MADLSIPAANIFPSFVSKLFWFALLALPILGMVLPRTMGFMPGIVSLILVIMAVLLRNKQFTIPKVEIYLYCGLGIIVFSSLYWTPNFPFSFERALKIFTISMLGLIFLSWAREISLPKKPVLLFLFILSYSFFGLFLFYEQNFKFQITSFILAQENLTSEKLNRSFVIFSLFFVPVLFSIKNLSFSKKNKTILSILVIAISFSVLFISSSQTAQLSLIVGTFFFFLYPIKNHVVFHFFSGLIIIGFLSFPFLVKPAQHYLNNHEEVSKNYIVWQASIPHRLEIWSHSVNEIQKSPIYGHGLEALRFMKSDRYMETARTDNVLHSHNVALQIGVEFGLIGLLFACLVVFYFLYLIWNTKNNEVKKLYLAVFMACLSCAMTGYGFWQSWHLGLFFMLTSFSVAIGRQYKNNLD